MQKFRITMMFITIVAWAFVGGVLIINDFHICIDHNVNVCLFLTGIGSISGILSYVWSLDKVKAEAQKESNNVKEKYYRKLLLVERLQVELTQYIHDNFKSKSNEHENTNQQS